MVWNHVRSDGPLWKIQPDYSLNPYIKVWTELNPNETQESGERRTWIISTLVQWIILTK